MIAVLANQDGFGNWLTSRTPPPRSTTRWARARQGSSRRQPDHRLIHRITKRPGPLRQGAAVQTSPAFAEIGA